MLYVAILLCIIYTSFLLFIYCYWAKVPEKKQHSSNQLSATFTVLIPARNEEQNIHSCLRSILQQTYPRSQYEIIVIDDFSVDATRAIVATFPEVKLLCLKEYIAEGATIAHKKAALEYGIQQANGNIIITTDADCVAGPGWLAAIASSFADSATVAIAAPVNFHQTNDRFTRFQALDYIGMMGLTAAGTRSGLFHLANGANFAFRKSAFEMVHGYTGINTTASGDDVLLVQKIAQHFPRGIHFLQSLAATVHTLPQRNWNSFVEQRLRWASKSGQYKDKWLNVFQAFVFLYCLLCAFCFVMSPFIGWNAFIAMGVLVLTKSAVDYFYLRSLCRFFGQEELMRDFYYAQCMHIVYILVIGGLSILGVKKGAWKGRRLF